MPDEDDISLITSESLFHLKFGERRRLRSASTSAEGRIAVANLIVEFLSELSESDDSSTERAFVLGREMKSVWSADFPDQLSEYMEERAPPSLWHVFRAGFESRPNEMAPKGLPTLARLNSIVELIEKAGVAAASEAARRIISEHLEYTERSGFSNFLVRATTRLSICLIRRPQNERFQGGALAQTFLRDALRWEPWNEILWSLWSDSYSAQGGFEPAEIVLWEAMRRFPDNPVFVAKLIRHLNRQKERLPEAHEIAQIGLGRFPKNSYLANAAAVNLYRSGRLGDAIDLMVSTLRRRRTDDFNIGMLGTAMAAVLRDEWKSFDEFTARISKLPQDPVLLGKICRALNQQKVADVHLVRFLRYAVSRVSGDIFLRNWLASILVRSNEASDREEGVAIFKGVLEEEPENSFALDRLLHIDDNRSQPDGLIPELNEEELSDIDGEVNIGVNRGELSDVGGLLAKPLWPRLPHMVERLGRGRRLRARLGAANDNIRNRALEELNELLREDPTFAYAQVLAVRQGVWVSTSRAPTAFAAAFENALKIKDLGALRELGERAPRLRPLTVGARALFGEVDAVAVVRSWVDAEQNRTELEARVATVLSTVVGVDSTPLNAEAIVDGVSHLQELNEWSLYQVFDVAA